MDIGNACTSIHRHFKSGKSTPIQLGTTKRFIGLVFALRDKCTVVSSPLRWFSWQRTLLPLPVAGAFALQIAKWHELIKSANLGRLSASENSRSNFEF